MKLDTLPLWGVSICLSKRTGGYNRSCHWTIQSGMVLYHQNEEIGTMISENQYELNQVIPMIKNRFYHLTDTLTTGQKNM
ncbi:hypothetical protein ACEQPO_24555 [Bacillus sp. SL00103]